MNDALILRRLDYLKKILWMTEFSKCIFSTMIICSATASSLAQGRFDLTSGYVSDVDSAGNVAFTLTFNQAPDFFTTDDFGRTAHAFQFYISKFLEIPAPLPPQPYASVVRGSEIRAANVIRVRDNGPSDSGDPDSGGWGPIRGSVPYSLVGDTLSFTIPADVLNVQYQTRFAYSLSLTEYGSGTTIYPNLSGGPIIPDPPVGSDFTFWPLPPAPISLNWQLATTDGRHVDLTINGIGHASSYRYDITEDNAFMFGLDWQAFTAAMINPVYNRSIMTYGPLTQEESFVNPSLRFQLDRISVNIEHVFHLPPPIMPFARISVRLTDFPVPEPASWVLVMTPFVSQLMLRRRPLRYPRTAFLCD